MVEHWTEAPCVAGSIPVLAKNIKAINLSSVVYVLQRNTIVVTKQKQQQNLCMINIGGKQYTVQQEDCICIDLAKQKNQPGDSILAPCFMNITKSDGICTKVEILPPEKQYVKLQILSKMSGPKTIAYKYKKRKGYQRTVGHKQKYFVAKVGKLMSKKKSTDKKVSIEG